MGGWWVRRGGIYGGGSWAETEYRSASSASSTSDRMRGRGCRDDGGEEIGGDTSRARQRCCELRGKIVAAPRCATKWCERGNMLSRRAARHDMQRLLALPVRSARLSLTLHRSYVYTSHD